MDASQIALNFMGLVIALGVVLSVLVILFLLFRTLALWYWKVEEGLTALRDTAQAARETRDAVRALTAAVTDAQQQAAAAVPDDVPAR